MTTIENIHHIVTTVVSGLSIFPDPVSPRGGRKVGEQLVTLHLRRSLKCLLSPCCCAVSQRPLQADALGTITAGSRPETTSTHTHSHTHTQYLSSSLSFNARQTHTYTLSFYVKSAEEASSVSTKKKEIIHSSSGRLSN